MRDEPNVELRCQTIRSSDTTKGVDSSKQQGGGHRSRHPLRNVLTHLPNELALKMDGAKAYDRYSTIGIKANSNE